MVRNKKFTIFIIAFLAITLPVLLLGIRQTLNSRSNAAAADKLEAEGGTLGGNATTQTDSNASGGSYVALGINQTSQNTGVYGMGISGDSLANTPLGGPYLTNVQFMRFRATQTSNLISFKFYYIGPPDPGYAGGTGGTWSAGIYKDDGSVDHLPTGSPIAPVTNVAAMLAYSGEAGRLITLTTPAPLTAGELYHLVFTNTDSNPSVNYFSPDFWYLSSIPDRNAGTTPYPTQIHPLLPNSDWGHGYKTNSGNWVIRQGYLPVLDLAYANGAHQGWSYAEASYGGVDEIGEINGTSKMVREKITVSGGDKIVSGASIRLLKTNGNSPLVIKLKSSSGAVIDSFNISASNIATGPVPTFASKPSSDDLGAKAKYVSGNFSSPKTLTNGSIYYLEISTAADTTYWAWVNRRLSSNPYLYHSSTYFKDGVAEYTRDGSTWANLGRSKGDQDLQFYFNTTSAQTNTPTPTNLACPTNLQTAINNTAVEGTLDITGCSFPITSTVTISKSMTLKGGTINTPTTGITITASNVTIDGVHIIGPQSSSYSLGQNGIFSNVTSQNLIIKKNIIENFGEDGIRISNSTNLNISGNTIKNIVYSGILIMSGTGGIISGNSVSNVGVTGYEANGMNAYGIALSDQGGPPSSGITISANTIDNVPQWHGLDTHGGRNLSFINNVIHRTNRAIFITPSSANGAASDITISNNTMDTPTKRIDVINTYPYNEVGITIVSGTSNASGTGNKFDGWPAGNHIDTQGGPNNFTNSTITNPQ